MNQQAEIISIIDHLKRKSNRMKGVGLYATFSREGDWAFDYALSLARYHKTKLNIFHFLESPYMLRRDVVFVDAEKKRTVQVTPEFISNREKQMREAFDEKLGDYLDVGFRLCEGNNEFELRKCFKKAEFAILVIGYEKQGAAFGGSTDVEKFAKKFRGPVILVGPSRPDSYYLNAPAERRLVDLMIRQGQWQRI